MYSASMARSTDPLVVGRVIGDVIDMFLPSMDMAVYYGSKQVINGCKIKPSATVDYPNMQIVGPPKCANSKPTLHQQSLYFGTHFMNN